MAEQPPDTPSELPPRRTSLTVASPQQADELVIDLTESGVDRSHVATHPVDAVDEPDDSFLAGQGRAFGRGWLIGFLAGAVLGALIVGGLLAVLYEPPWSSGISAAITLGAALGIGYICAGIGFLQAGIARAGETGGDAAAPAGHGHRVEVVVDATDPSEQRIAQSVFERHARR